MNSVCAQFDVERETVQEFIQRFTVQCSDLLCKAGDDSIKKAAILVKALPITAITDLQRRIKPVLLSAAKYDELIEKLTSQYEVKKSVVGASVKFLNRKQTASESIETYAKVLNDLASSCNYKDCCRDRMLKDVFIAGLQSSAILSSLLQESEKNTFNQCIERAKLLEALTADAQDMKSDTNLHASYKLNNSNSSRNPTFSRSKPNDSIPHSYICIRCTARGKHLAKDCFAINLKCKSCAKNRHISKACRSSKSHSVWQDEGQYEDEQSTYSIRRRVETDSPERSYTVTSHDAIRSMRGRSRLPVPTSRLLSNRKQPKTFIPAKKRLSNLPLPAPPSTRRGNPPTSDNGERKLHATGDQCQYGVDCDYFLA